MESGDFHEEKIHSHSNKNDSSEIQTWNDLSAEERQLLSKYQADISFRKALCSLLTMQDDTAETEAKEGKK